MSEETNRTRPRPQSSRFCSLCFICVLCLVVLVLWTS